MKKSTVSPGQMALGFFDVPPQPQTDTGSLDVSSLIREVLADILSESKSQGSDRYTVAADLSRLSGRDISKNMLDRYCSISADDWRFPLETLPALVQSTRNFKLLELIVQACGCRLLRGEEAMLAEIGALMLHEKATKSRLDSMRRAISPDVMDRLIDEVLTRIGKQAS